MTFDEKLLELRKKIDGIDTQLLDLLNQRAQFANEVGEIKRKEGAAVYRPEREVQVINALQANNQGPLKSDNVATIWREIMSACRALEAPQRVAFLGPQGTFSQEAAFRFFGSSIEPILCNNFDEVFHAATSGRAQFGVIPIENSTEGVVTRSLDLLLTSPLHIIGEISLLIRHHLLRKTRSLENIEIIYAHPQALAQCQNWINTHLPNAQRQAVASNAEGARLASQNNAWAALASERASSEFGLHIAAHAVQDEAFNRTRFLSICLPQTCAMPTASGKDCVSLVASVPNKPGAMHDLLVPIKANGVSMTRFESRPAKSGQWEYYFYIDLQGHPSEPRIAKVLQQLREICAFYKMLGAYPVSE